MSDETSGKMSENAENSAQPEAQPATADSAQAEQNAQNTAQTAQSGPTHEEYVPEPRGEARVPGVNIQAIDERLRECKEYFYKHCDEADYRNLDWYLWRMQLKYAAGDDIYMVLDDAFLAARCLHDKHQMHLELKPPEMFMTRRITPVELGIISGMPMLTLEFSATYGLPLMMVLGKTAPEELTNEANLMTSFFRRGFCADFVELTGLAAVIYAGVIAAIGRGFDDEAIVGLNTYAKARDSLRGTPPKSLLSRLKRYDALNTALACLCAGNFDMIGGILAPEAEDFAAEQAKRAGDAWNAPDKMPPPKYFDMSILAILALTALRSEVIDLPKTGAIAHYSDFIRGFTVIPERRIEVPGLDEESRRILKEAGIDPDQMAGNYYDHSIEDAKEESEARAASLFEERQRKAQESVRYKLAQGVAYEDSAAAVEPEKLEREKLRLNDNDDSDNHSTPKKDFSNFFAEDDETDAAARRANDEIFNASQSQNTEHDNSNHAKDFSGFFDASDDSQAHQNAFEADAELQNDKPAKDFNAFFSDDDKEDGAIRAHVEEESAEAADSGRNYASFFENLDEKAIPEYDDGTKDDIQEVHAFSKDFFTDDHKPLSGLKMTADADPEPQKPAEPAAKPLSPIIQEALEKIEHVEDNSPRKDFTKLFDEDAPLPATDLQMSLDDKENETLKKSAPKTSTVSKDNALSQDTIEDNSPRKDFTKLFDENAPLPATDLQMSLDDKENEAITKAAQTNHASANAVNIDTATRESIEDNSPRKDFTKLFDENAPLPATDLQMSLDDKENEAITKAAQTIHYSEPSESETAGDPLVDSAPRKDFTKLFDEKDQRREDQENETDDTETQLRELAEEQARKHAQKIEKQQLKLALDGTEHEVKQAESYQQRMARLIAEKQAAARELALREREEALRELEEMKKAGPQKPVIEELQLKPTESDDPDEHVQKVTNTEDLVIKGFAYDELDRIHENTREAREIEEDFDLHAAVAQKEWEEAKNKADNPKKSTQNDDDINIVIDYAALADNKKEDSDKN